MKTIFCFDHHNYGALKRPDAADSVYNSSCWTGDTFWLTERAETDPDHMSRKWAEDPSTAFPRRHFSPSVDARKNTPPTKPAMEEVSQRTFLTAPRGCYHWIWLHFLVQNRQHRSDMKLVWGVKAQPGILRVLHSRSVSLGLFLFTLCWKSAEQTPRNKVKGWFYYLIKSIFEGLFEAGL